jgi:UDP-glucose 4-epimerase
MRILFTGASSFTGSWFVRTLAASGHEVVATFRSPLTAYEGVRARRVADAAAAAEPVAEVAFGSPTFLDLLRDRSFDVLCHHAAEVTGYRSPDFDIEAAVALNTHELPAVLGLLAKNATPVVLTGSVFESDEGDGEDPLRAFSPYGVSKALTAEIFTTRCREAAVGLGKFVIPNPFGPLEEPRFTAYLARTWLSGEAALVQTPAYVRDNVHVTLLALAYVRFVEEVASAAGLSTSGGFRHLGPSGYVETQGEFSQRCSRELEGRLGVVCRVELIEQVDFPEPRIRFNTDRLDPAELGWDEARAWDELAAYYLNAHAAGALG